MTRRRTRKSGTDQSEPVRSAPGVNVFLESLKGRRIAGEPDPSLDELGDDELDDARELLHGFTCAGAAQRPRRRINFNDPIAVATLELQGRLFTDPRTSCGVGAWLARLKDRGAGHCTPLNGAAEGLHMLMLDAQAVAELWDAMAAHRASVASYEELQADLAQLRKLKGGEGQS